MEKVEFSARASLVTIGTQFRRLKIWATVGEHVKIKQKVLIHTPLDKLLDCLINILAGGTGLVEINIRVRPDQAVQRAFGRTACAEQSTISDTLNACTAENVKEMRTAVTTILRQHGRSYRHDYEAEWQLLDADVTGMPAGRLGQGVTKGYFAQQKNRRGRQLGRVLATWYEEIVVDRLYNGKRQLDSSLPELISDAEKVLDLDVSKRKRTILRVDGGGGDDKNINWVLARDYHLLIKVKNWRRAEKLASSVTYWYPDPKVTDREVGWVEEPHPYAKPTRQLALRKRKANGEWSYHALVFTLTDEMLFHLSGRVMPESLEPSAILLAALHAYACMPMICAVVVSKRRTEETSKAWACLAATSIFLRPRRCWSCWPRLRTTSSFGREMNWRKQTRGCRSMGSSVRCETYCRSRGAFASAPTGMSR